MSAEREAKLAAPPGFDLPDLDGVIEGVHALPEEAQRIQAVYYDTEDLRIARWGCSLRYRNVDGWTVKLPPTEEGDLLVRAEYLFEGAASRPPDAAVDLVRAYVRSAPVAPTARLQTLRARVALHNGDGRELAEVTDDEVSVLHGRRVAARFREVEVELRDGAPEHLLPSAIGRLRAAGAGEASTTPKYLHAMGSRAMEPPEVVVAAALDERSNVTEVVREAIAVSTVRLLRHDAGVRLGEDPEAVHQARVATRRLRSDLRTFRSLLDPEWTVGLRGELGWLGAELGAVRDSEVLLERLRRMARDLPDVDRQPARRLLDRLARRRQAARKELLDAIRSERYVTLLDRLVDASGEPRVLVEAAELPAIEVLAPLMEGPWKHLKAACEGLAADSADAELHQTRIRTKRARYAAEALAPAFGKRAWAFAAAAADLQSLLGEHQDAVIAEAWLRQAVAHATGRTAFVAGELAGMQRGARESVRRAWPDLWRALSRKKLRFWT